MNYWYGSRYNEIFLDLDSRRALFRALRVLRLAMLRHELPVKELYFYPTTKPGRGHLIVVLNSEMAHLDRFMWSLWMGSDRLRLNYVYGRLQKGVQLPDLLTSRKPYHRAPDATCECSRKHKATTVTENCPALRQILGELRSEDFYPRIGRRRCAKIRIKAGRIQLSKIRRWSAG